MPLSRVRFTSVLCRRMSAFCPVPVRNSCYKVPSAFTSTGYMGGPHHGATEPSTRRNLPLSACVPLFSALRVFTEVSVNEVKADTREYKDVPKLDCLVDVHIAYPPVLKSKRNSIRTRSNISLECAAHRLVLTEPGLYITVVKPSCKGEEESQPSGLQSRPIDTMRTDSSSTESLRMYMLRIVLLIQYWKRATERNGKALGSVSS